MPHSLVAPHKEGSADLLQHDIFNIVTYKAGSDTWSLDLKGCGPSVWPERHQPIHFPFLINHPCQASSATAISQPVSCPPLEQHALPYLVSAPSVIVLAFTPSSSHISLPSTPLSLSVFLFPHSKMEWAIWVDPTDLICARLHAAFAHICM
jgi:hypothetical protein